MLKVLNPRTTIGKTGRTMIQALLAQVLVYATSDSFRHFITDHHAGMAFLLPAVIAVVTFIYNKLDPKVPDTQADLRRMEQNAHTH